MAVEAVHKNYDKILDFKSDGKTIASSVEDIICDLPSAQPERKPGKWILDDESIDCSACRHEKWSRVPYESLVKRFKFCPNCGADMRGE